MDSPGCGLTEGEILQPYIAATRESHQDRRGHRLAFASQLLLFLERPSAAVDHALALHGDILRVEGANQHGASVVYRIIGDIGAGQEEGALLQA